MQVQRIQNNNNYNTNFTGKFFKGSGFKRLESSLNDAEKEYWQKIVRDIENAGDDHNHWWFAFSKIHDNKVKLVRIGSLDYEGKPDWAMFREEINTDSDAVKIFEQLHNWYKNNVENFKW